MSNSTTVFQAVRLWDAEHFAIKWIAIIESKLQRDIYNAAYLEMARRRKKWTPSPDQSLQRFSWLAAPKAGEGRKRLTVGVKQGAANALLEWAEHDGVAVIDVCYTAVYEYLMDYGPIEGLE